MEAPPLHCTRLHVISVGLIRTNLKSYVRRNHNLGSQGREYDITARSRPQQPKRTGFESWPQLLLVVRGGQVRTALNLPFLS